MHLLLVMFRTGTMNVQRMLTSDLTAYLFVLLRFRKNCKTTTKQWRFRAPDIPIVDFMFFSVRSNTSDKNKAHRLAAVPRHIFALWFVITCFRRMFSPNNYTSTKSNILSPQQIAYHWWLPKETNKWIMTIMPASCCQDEQVWSKGTRMLPHNE